MSLQTRLELISCAQKMAPLGLNQGTAGNLSVRGEWDGKAGFWITPTGMDYAELRESDIPFVELAGSGDGDAPPPNSASRRQASSEWRLHLDLYRAHPAFDAILHAHSPFATSLACLRREIPPFHYMIARFGGDTVRCSAYALFGTQALSNAALAAMVDRSACLLANHGMVVGAAGLTQALAAAVELESLCEQYWRACQLGQPVLLDGEEMAAVKVRFADYGKQR